MIIHKKKIKNNFLSTSFCNVAGKNLRHSIGAYQTKTNGYPF